MEESSPAYPHSDAGALDPLRHAGFVRLFAATASSTLASRGMAVVLGYQVYDLTHSTMALGLLGLVEAIPAVSLALYGGHIADRRDRRVILQTTLLMLSAAAAALAALQFVPAQSLMLPLLYMVVFVAGIARGFAEPAAGALEAQVVPRELLIRSSTLMASCWLSGAVIGPLLAGVAYAGVGAPVTFGAMAILYGVGSLLVASIAPTPIPTPPATETVWESVAVGVRYVLRSQVLLGSMALDLFAVLFGGAIALLPAFASDILHVGPIGLGMLNAAPTLGALLIMLVAMRWPPVKHAGRNLFLAVTGFGVVMIVFALSENFWLSAAMLFFSGVFDGVSVVIRRSILRLMSPEHLRGRIAAVSMIFIGSSNEIGALESGVAATLLGTARSVWMGGLATLAIVAIAAAMAPELRTLSLGQHQAEPRDAELDEAIAAGEA